MPAIALCVTSLFAKLTSFVFCTAKFLKFESVCENATLLFGLGCDIDLATSFARLLGADTGGTSTERGGVVLGLRRSGDSVLSMIEGVSDAWFGVTGLRRSGDSVRLRLVVTGGPRLMRGGERVRDLRLILRAVLRLRCGNIVLSRVGTGIMLISTGFLLSGDDVLSRSMMSLSVDLLAAFELAW